MCDSKFRSGTPVACLSELLGIQELDLLVGAVSNPKGPFAAGVGDSKVSSKIGVIELLLE